MPDYDHDFKKFPELSNGKIEELQFLSPHPQITENFEAEVEKVVDGDTVRLKTNFRDFDFPLRMIGINAPEMNAGGEEARDWLKGRIEKQKVFIEIEKNNRVDKYGRLLGRLFHGGMDVAQEEIYLGLAPPFEESGQEILSIGEIFSIEKALPKLDLST